MSLLPGTMEAYDPMERESIFTNCVFSYLSPSFTLGPSFALFCINNPNYFSSSSPKLHWSFPLLSPGQPSSWPTFFLNCKNWTHKWMPKVLTNAGRVHHVICRLLSCWYIPWWYLPFCCNIMLVSPCHLCFFTPFFQANGCLVNLVRY